jgi:hypothetical protein
MGKPMMRGVMLAPRTINSVGPRLFGAERYAVIEVTRLGNDSNSMLVSRSICCSCSNITMSFEPQSIDAHTDQIRGLGV